MQLHETSIIGPIGTQRLNCSTIAIKRNFSSPELSTRIECGGHCSASDTCSSFSFDPEGLVCSLADSANLAGKIHGGTEVYIDVNKA